MMHSVKLGHGQEGRGIPREDGKRRGDKVERNERGAENGVVGVFLRHRANKTTTTDASSISQPPRSACEDVGRRDGTHLAQPRLDDRPI
jgi:hypothetical protein